MKITKILFSIPIILLLLYFLPPLGVIVLLARYAFYGNRHFFRAPIAIVVTSLIIALPYGLDWLIKTANINIPIPYLNDILSWEYYPQLLDSAKFSFIVAIIVLVLTILLRNLISTIPAPETLEKLYKSCGCKYLPEHIGIDPALSEEILPISAAIRNRLTLVRMLRVLEF